MKSLASTATFISAASAALYDAPVQIKNGLVQGYPALNSSTVSNFSNWKDITVWKGIPFAASAAGQNRWKAPQPASNWNSTLLASTYGPGCAQASGGALMMKRQSTTTSTTSEDCLSVNIWSPATSSDERLPVAVWSYGAGSTSSSTQFDGSGMADQGIVFVTYNYRTGPFGWLALPELSAESPHNVSGNYGLLDQIEVLRWIKDNIQAFGGDPEHVTTVGQSFGSGAVLHQINSPLANGLIVGAIAESGIKDPYDPELSGYGSNYVNYSTLTPFSQTYVSSLDVTSVAALRSLSTDELLTGTGAGGFSSSFDPVLDGWAIPTTYLGSLEQGPANDVPVLAGNNRDEDGVRFDAVYNVSAYETAVQSYYNSTKWADIFLELYPANTTAKATTSYKAQLRDGARVSTWSWANRWAETASSPVYTYEWDHAPPGQDQGAFHASEIPYALNSLHSDTDTAWLPADYEIAAKVSSYWANFIKTGNPNQGGSYKSGNGSLVDWPASSGDKNTTFNIGDSFGEDLLATGEQIEAVLGWFADTSNHVVY